LVVTVNLKKQTTASTKSTWITIFLPWNMSAHPADMADTVAVEAMAEAVTAETVAVHAETAVDVTNTASYCWRHYPFMRRRSLLFPFFHNNLAFEFLLEYFWS
jgi:hypothetical protein